MKNTKPYDNLYAIDEKGDGIFIGDAVRGREGYYCEGCGEEMEAVKGPLRRYFRHIVKDRKIIRKCTYSSEKYRHKLAKEILQNIKQIRVPPIYKYPPTNRKDLGAYKIRDGRVIHAHKVLIERQFYEDASGQIRWGQSIDFELPKNKNKHLLIQPDVAFFDKNDQPILLIECVATHKVDVKKAIKIKRLGIDTVEVVIPKDSPEAIKEVFYHTKKTEWIYNHEQANTHNVQFPNSIRKEYYQLLNSKDNFLEQKNLSSAEKVKLEILYEELKNAWNRNNTSTLSKHLEQKYQELRKMQNELESNCSEFEQVIEKEYRTRLDWRKTDLAQQRKNLQENWQNLARQKQIWKTDILQKMKKLEMHKATMNQSANQKLQELKTNLSQYKVHQQLLQKASKKLEQKKWSLNSTLQKALQETNEIKEQNNLLNSKYQKELAIYQQNMQQLRNKLEQPIRTRRYELSSSLSKIVTTLDNDLQQIENELNENLKSEEERLLRQLKTEIIQENSHYTDESKTWLEEWNLSKLSYKSELLTNRLNKLERYLETNLTKIGYDVDEFITKMEQNQPIS